MKRTNVEIKARCPDHDGIRRLLRERGAEFRGEDRQTDTYFRVPEGRLKLREGTIENNLIFYRRDDRKGPGLSDVELYPSPDPAGLKAVLGRALEVLLTVRKKREIWYLENVRFHIDEVDGLGSFVEIEAIDSEGTRSPSELRRQCREYMEHLGIPEKQLVAVSYSDLLMNS